MSAKNWCVTIFGEREHATLLSRLEQVTTYAIAGREICPKTQRIHQQCYFQFTQKRRINFIKSILGEPTAHCEIARGSPESNTQYCRKDGDWHEQGVPVVQGQRTDMESIKTDLINGKSLNYIADNYFSQFIRYHKGFEKYYQMLHKEQRNFKSTVEVYYGEPGSGKTRKAQEENPDAFWLLRSSGKVWWDGYEQQDTIIIDDFYGWMPFDYLLRLCDRYPFRVEVKGGSIQFLSHKIIFTSNKHPSEWYNPEKCCYEALKRRIEKIEHFIKYFNNP